MKKLRKADYFAVVIILCAAFAIMAFGYKNGSGEALAVVRQNNVEIRRIALAGLSQKINFTVEGENGENEITAENGKIAFTKASCKHQTCVQTGWISRPGQAAVCLENKVSITIEGQNLPDAIAK